MSIVVVGSSNTDMIIKMPRIPVPGETVLGGEFTTAAGGKGANQAVAAARAGGKVAFIARVGDDMFGRKTIEGLKQDDIDVEHVLIDPDAPSGIAMIFVDENGENSIAVASGANANLSVDDVKNATDVMASADVLLMQLETPVATIRAASRIAQENNKTIILNPAPAQELDDALLSNLSVLTPNESEAQLLTGIKVTDAESAERAARALLEKGPEMVIVTRGAEGALLVTEETTEAIGGYKVNAVDATAAGDTFNGALAAGLAEGKTPEESVRMANAAASLSVTKLGARPSVPSRAEIEMALDAG